LENNKVSIRLDLEGDEAKEFREIMKKRGFTLATQFVRFLIASAKKEA
jgi:hypothetical protein